MNYSDSDAGIVAQVTRKCNYLFDAITQRWVNYTSPIPYKYLECETTLPHQYTHLQQTRNDLYASILSDLSGRTSWDERCKMFYEMRHHGLRRKNKPWPGASDIHVPIGDMSIQKLLPYYFQQIFATDVLAQFVPVVAQSSAVTTAASQWFDYQLKQRSKLETEILTVIDHILVSGRGVMKTYWNSERARLEFQAVDPQHIIVPAWTNSIDEADRIVHVQRYSPEAYRRNANFLQDEGIIEQITGAYSTNAADDSKQQEKFSREGITWSSENHIIVWEVWTHTGSSDWLCETFSPSAPDIDLRPPMESPYAHGKPPFVAFSYEIKDKGWYSPRGVMEQVAVFEVEATRAMNEKNDATTLYNRPLFKSARDIPNSANLRFRPGTILPYDIAPIQMPQPPISFDSQMMIARELAQQRITTPDFGISSVVDAAQRRTATEIQAISGLHQQSSDLRMRIFRIGLAELYRLSWSLLLQYNRTSLNFWYIDTVKTVPQEGLHEQYGIIPSGSADGVNKPLLVQKVFQRFQLLSGNPFIDQGELVKSVLEADDATLVRRLFVDPQGQQVEQSEDQALELSILRLGFPAQVRPNDDHKTHIQTILAYVTSRVQTGSATEPLEAQALQQHLVAHIEALRQTDKKLAKEAEDAAGVVFEQAAQFEAQQQQQQQPYAQVPQDPAGPPAGMPTR